VKNLELYFSGNANQITNRVVYPLFGAESLKLQQEFGMHLPEKMVPRLSP
jgi:hypothetical protein